MVKRLGLIHTVSSLVGPFSALCADLLPTISIFHMVDESLIQAVIRDGHVLPTTARRVVRHMISAEEAGADAIMVTCSSVGECVSLAQPLLRVPAYRVDLPMADKAVRMGQYIGVAATLPTTLEPTARLVQARAATIGKSVEVMPKLCSGAFEAMLSGDVSTHDTIVRDGLRELMHRVDVVVLAQASMARVVEGPPGVASCVPILASPRLAVEFLATMLECT